MAQDPSQISPAQLAQLIERYMDEPGMAGLRNLHCEMHIYNVDWCAYSNDRDHGCLEPLAIIPRRAELASSPPLECEKRT